MRKLLLIIALTVLNVLASIAADNNGLWKMGNFYYEQKQYDSAAYYFEQIAAQKPHNAAVYYNLGNTYYRLNKVAPAILNYERALRIDPDNQNAKDNLALAQGRIASHIVPVNDIFFVSWWHSLTEPDMATMWAILALVFFAIIIIVAFARRFGKSGFIPVQLQGVLGLVCFCFLAMGYSAAKNSLDHDAAVVMEHDAPLMNGDQKGKPLALVPEGTTVKILGEKGMWVEVSLPDGRNGWLQKELIDKI